MSCSISFLGMLPPDSVHLEEGIHVSSQYTSPRGWTQRSEQSLSLPCVMRFLESIGQSRVATLLENEVREARQAAYPRQWSYVPGYGIVEDKLRPFQNPLLKGILVRFNEEQYVGSLIGRSFQALDNSHRSGSK